VYLLLFGFGTVAGMMLITSVIAVPFAMSQAIALPQRSPAGRLAVSLGLRHLSGLADRCGERPAD
jgi:hypothetical protein